MQIHCLDPEGINEYEKLANDVLSQSLPSTWKAYSALTLVGRKEQSAEFDLIIITADRVIVVEIKEWNGVLFSNKGKWVVQFDNHHQSERTHGLKQARRASQILSGFIRKLRTKIFIPDVEYCVVLAGSATPENLPENEREKVFTLDVFKNFGNPKKFEQAFGATYPKSTPKKKQDRPNQNLAVWDRFFTDESGNFRPRIFTFDGYAIKGPAFFQHNNKIYSEYHSSHIDNRSHKAIMRRWDFNQPSIIEHSLTSKERILINQRESKILSYIDSQEEDLMDIHLSFKPPGQKTNDTELYNFPGNKARLDDYISRNKGKLTPVKRIELVKIFISHLARLHQINVAHRNIGPHSVWLSNSSLGITLSNFVAASYPKEKKISQQLLNILAHKKIQAPEDLNGKEEELPFARDVFLAGSVAHLIVFGEWPSKSENGIYFWQPIDGDEFKGSLNSWFEKLLDFEASNRFDNLTIALDDLFDSSHINEISKNDALLEFEKYYRNTDIYAKYAHKQIREPKGTSLFYKSNDESVAIKVWNGVSNINEDSSANIHLLTFLNRTQTLLNSKVEGAPRIIEFGFNDAFKALFVAYEWVDGETWKDFVHYQSAEIVCSAILRLVKSIAQIHQNKLTHGHIHPDNIICQKNSEEIHPKFVDLFDFFIIPEHLENNDYEPKNYLDLSITSRDRFAIVKIVKEAAESSNLTDLENHCVDLLNQSEVTEGDFNRLIDNYENIVDPSKADEEINIFSIRGWNFPPGRTELNSDNGTFYLTCRVENNDEVRVFLSGQLEKTTIRVSLQNRDIIVAYKPTSISHSEYIKFKRNAEIEFKGKITLIHSDLENTAPEFVQRLLDNHIVQEKISRYRTLQLPAQQEVEPEFDIKKSISRIWLEMVEAEYKSYPSIYLTSEPLRDDNFKDNYYANFVVEGNQPDFDLEREYVSIKRFSGSQQYLQTCGFVMSIGSGIIQYRTSRSNSLKEGDSVLLESNLAASSMKKRKDAIEAIINERATIPGLIKYFDWDQECTPEEIPNMEITDEELDLYTETQPDGEVFELNESQRDAFKKLYKFGPLGLLQGPPGTGKTAFIGTFIHYMISKGAKKVLIACQSHEAVNNAADKVREIFHTKNENVSIIRLGDEDHISESLLDVTENSLQDNYRELFRAEIKHRIMLAAKSLNLADEFITLSIEFELSFGRNIKAIESLMENKQRAKSWLKKLSNFFSTNFDHEPELELNKMQQVHETFYRLAETKFEIDSPLNIDKYRNIINIALEWIDVMSSSGSQFQNFLVKTRTVVCGTCVGIARLHYGINENTYDLVVIDEASRASSSELAIAMQIGRKIVLVGDHKQLPPLYKDEDIQEVYKQIGVSKEELKRSDFERSFLSSYGKNVGQRLSIQYRMAPPIGNLISDCFYDSQLKTGRDVSNKVFDNLPENLGTTVTWFDTSNVQEKAYERTPLARNLTTSTSKENNYEANLIIELIRHLSEAPQLKEFLKSKESPQIGVICMYKEQVRLIREKLRSRNWLRRLEDEGVLKIDTVDSYQGKENSIIIVSLVRNNKAKNIGFLRSENRANVALSRAKERLYIVNSTNMWTESNSSSAFGKVLSYIQRKESSNYKIIDSTNLLGGE